MPPMTTTQVPPRLKLDWTLEAVSLAALAVMFLIVRLRWAEVPELVPRHFGISGLADRWGSKSDLWTSCLNAAGLWAVITATAGVMDWIKLPQTKRRLVEVLRLQRQMLLWLKTVIVLSFGYTEWVAMKIALGSAGGLGVPFLPIELVTTPLIIVVYLARMARCRG